MKPKSKSTQTAIPIYGRGFNISGQGEMPPETFDTFVGSKIFWQSKAQDLMDSANVLWSINCQKLREQVLGTSFAVVWMLSGFALENAFKAVIIPTLEIKKSGQLPSELNTHKLVKLAKMAKVDVDANEKAMLAYLTEFVEAYGRYPVHTSHDKMHKNGSIGSDHVAAFQTVWAIWLRILALGSTTL
jgi:hypothetical protein